MLVTGGAGFIGSSFVRLAVSAGHEVRVLDALTYAGNLANLEPVLDSGKCRFSKGDIRDAALVERLLREDRPRVVVNFAAESHVDRSIHDAHPFLQTNVVGTQVLLDAVRAHPEPIRFIQISTDEVYGSATAGRPFSEDSPLRPSSPYAASKAGADLLVLAAHRTFGLDVVITRCSNNYGPYQFPEKLIPLFVTNLIEGKPVPLYGDGLQVRDWIHCDDHSRAVLAAIERGRPGEVYNVSAGQPMTNLDLTRRLLRLTGREESLIRHVPDRPGHDRAYLLDASKARRELRWAPVIEFSRGLEETVAWYRENRRWWEEIKNGAYRNYYAMQYGNPDA